MLQTNTNSIFATALHNLDEQTTLWPSLASKTLDYSATLTSLNMAAMRAALAQADTLREQLAGATTPADIYQSLLAHAQPNLEKSIAYGREVAAITSRMQTDLNDTIQQQISETKQHTGRMLSGATGSAPDGAASLFELIRSSYTQFAKSAVDATESMQANLAHASTTLGGDAARAASRSKK